MIPEPKCQKGCCIQEGNFIFTLNYTTLEFLSLVLLVVVLAVVYNFNQTLLRLKNKHQILHLLKCARVFPKLMEMCSLHVPAGQGSSGQESQVTASTKQVKNGFSPQGNM